MIDDNGNVTLYLYDDLNRQVAQTEGLVVGSTYTEANILGPRVIPTPTAATIDNPAMIPNCRDQRPARRGAGADRRRRAALPVPGQPGQRQPADDDRLGLRPGRQRPDHAGRERLRDVHEVRRHQPPDRRPDLPRRPARLVRGRPDLRPGPGLDLRPSRGTRRSSQGTTMQNFQYDGLSRMTFAFDNNDPTTPADDSTVTDAYDSLGRIIEEAQTIGGQPTQVISSAWRADDLRSSADLPQRPRRGLHLRQPRPAQDRLRPGRGAADRGLRVHRRGSRARAALPAERDARDLPRRLRDHRHRLRRPAAGRSRSATCEADNSLIVGFTYTYDRMGNKLTEGKLHDPANSETYTYDSAYRLITFNRAPGGIAPSQSTWTLDGVGNWIAGQRPVAAVLLHQRADPAAPGGRRPRDGPLRQQRQRDRRRHVPLQLRRLQPPAATVTRKSDGALVAVYSYDADGRRISKVVTNSGTLTAPPTSTTTAGRTSRSTTAPVPSMQQYVFGANIDEPLVMDRNLGGGSTATGPGDQRLFYNQNTLYSVYALTDTTGKIVEGYQYDAYGRQTVFATRREWRRGLRRRRRRSRRRRQRRRQPLAVHGATARSRDGSDVLQESVLLTDQGRFITRDPSGHWTIDR